VRHFDGPNCTNKMRSLTPLLAYSASWLCFLLSSQSALGQAGPPLLTDDPETPGNGHWEINVASTISQTRKDRLWALPLLDVNYGLGDRIQIKAEVPWLVLQPRQGGETESGIGSVNVGVKWRFLDRDQHGFSLSTYPQFEFRTSAASARKGLIESGAELRLPMEMSRQLGRAAIVGELGYQFVRHDKDEWIYGFAVRRKLKSRLEVLGEIHGESARDFRENEVLFNIGGRVELTSRYTLLFASGRSFKSASASAPTFQAYVGWQFRF
jgi:outer membrane putative beta-barrel porin/alpha-amylase